MDDYGSRGLLSEPIISVDVQVKETLSTKNTPPAVCTPRKTVL